MHFHNDVTWHIEGIEQKNNEQQRKKNRTKQQKMSKKNKLYNEDNRQLFILVSKNIIIL